MIEDDKKFLRMLQETFRMEAEEHLARIVADILALEQAQPEARHDIVERLLKTLHTLKGAARAANQPEMEALCHALESVCAALRTFGGVPDAAQFDVLHSAGRIARELLDGVTGRRRNQAGTVTARLNQIGAQMAQEDPAMPPASAAGAPPFAPGEESAPAQQDVVDQSIAPAPTEVVRVRGERLDLLRHQVEELLPVELGMQHHIDDLLELARRMEQAGEGGTPVGADAAAVLERECRRLAHGLGRARRQFEMLRTRMMDAVLETALIPLSYALEPLPALVRRLARSRGKEAVLDLQGGSIRIDRRVLDVARDALVHLVTNAVDHGLEFPEQRTAAGKPAAGRIAVHARQAADGRIAVSVEDDGAGIDVARVAEAARDAGYDEGQSGADGGENLILKTGVSTAVEVTQESGRGVGLSIVSEKLAALGGDLAIENRPGAGCTFRMRVPVRLSTMRGLVVGVQQARFVLPVSGLESVCALGEDDLRTVGDRETLMRGEKVIPAIRLGRLLRLGGAETGAGVALYVQAAGQVFALLVDEILAEQEILPKGLGKQLRRVSCIGGVAQLGDASLVPILALDDIARTGLSGGNGIAAASAQPQARVGIKRVLVVEDSITSRLLLKHILEGAGFRVDTAVDGLDALSRLRQETFDAVVSDIEMPRLDGLGLTERIRENPKTEHLPVILVTSLQSPQERERGLQAGADAYVVKGEFDQDNLLQTIGRLI